MDDVSKFLGGAVEVRQPVDGYRAGSDTVFLAATISAQRGEKILDLGCGVGTLGLLVKHHLPEVHITGLDVQQDMLDFAEWNARHNTLSMSFVTHDVANTHIGLGLPLDSFDQVVTNPPYFLGDAMAKTPDRHRSRSMVDVDLMLWIKFCHIMLRARGILTLIYPARSMDDVIQALKVHYFGAVQVFPLWPKAGVSAKRVIIRARKNVQSPAQMVPGLTLHEDCGQYTVLADNILRGKDVLRF